MLSPYRAVDDGEFADAVNGGAAEERHDGHLGAGAALEVGLQAVAQIDDASHVDFIDGVDVGAGAPGFDHALGDLLAHGRHRHLVAGSGDRAHGGRDGRGGCCGGGHRRRRNGRRAGGRGCGAGRMLLDEGQDVVLGDSAAQAGAGDAVQVHVVLARQVAHQRRGADTAGFLGLAFLGFGGNFSGRGRRRRSWRWGGSFDGGGGRSCGGAGFVDDADHGVDLDGRALGGLDFL